MLTKINYWIKKTDGLLILIPALISCALTNGLYNSPIFAWLYIIFTYRYTMYEKKHKDRYAFLMVLLITWVAMNIKWFNILDEVPLWVNMLAFLIIALFYTIPFFVAKKIIKYLPNNILRNFVFPCLWVLFDYIVSFIFAGTIISIAVSQYEFLSLIQICSITGLHGISFIICFTATIVNDFWNVDFKLKSKYRNRVVACFCLLIAILLFGSVRLSISDVSSDTIRTASVTHGYSDGCWDEDPEVVAAWFSNEKFNENLKLMEKDIQQTCNTNTKCINWPEESFPVTKKNYDKMVESCKALAAKYNVSLFVPLYMQSSEYLEENELHNNVLLCFDSAGNFKWRYDKCNLVPVYETSSIEPGDGTIYNVDLEGSNFAGVICFDAYFPSFIIQISKVDADVLIAPSYEWKSISTYSGYGTSFRSIENGCSYIRNAFEGLLIANDPYGRQLEYFQNYNTNENVVFVDLPKHGVPTFYGIAGDWFVAICLLYLIAIPFYILYNKKRGSASHR